MRTEWQVEHRRGGAQELHDADPPRGGRWLVVHEVLHPAIVLGSAQHVEGIEARAAAAGFEVARRRSGGGAVLLRPSGQVWIDVVLPAGDVLWDDDVERATWWLGDTWAAVLRPHVSDAVVRVHERGVDDREMGRLACFAALGPGEVSVQGRKVVGISQRRTRDLVRFQCVLHLRWEPVLLAHLLGGPTVERLATVLEQRAGAAPVPHGWGAVEDLRAHLP